MMWIVTVPTKETARFSMVNVPVSVTVPARASAVQGATVLVHENVLYVYVVALWSLLRLPKSVYSARSISLAQYTKSESYDSTCQ